MMPGSQTGPAFIGAAVVRPVNDLSAFSNAVVVGIVFDEWQQVLRNAAVPRPLHHLEEVQMPSAGKHHGWFKLGARDVATTQEKRAVVGMELAAKPPLGGINLSVGRRAK